MNVAQNHSRTLHLDAARFSARTLDVSRLLSRLHRKTPTGIDRVEFAYARHYAEAFGDADLRFLVTTPLNTGVLGNRLARHLIRTAVERWEKPRDDADANAAFAELRDVLARPIQPDQTRHHAINVREPVPDIADQAANAMKLSAYAAAVLGGWSNPRLNGVRGVPSWYLHVSHINLHQPARLDWLHRAGLRSMFLLHDLIPVSHPEYFLPEEDEKHRRRLGTIARLADLVVFNSQATRSAWEAFLDGTELRRPHGVVVPLGVETLFINGADGPRIEADVPYFVVTGTLESRKNLAFLLQVWRQWTEAKGIPNARLVIVGRRARHSENVVDLLDRSVAIAPTVVEAAALSDQGLATLLRGARALLAPSLIEGFGLPIAEALSLGVPVIASDMDAHREVGGSFAEYLDPLDGQAWLRALEDYTAPDSPRRTAMQARTIGYRASSWADHMGAVEASLAAFR